MQVWLAEVRRRNSLPASRPGALRRFSVFPEASDGHCCRWDMTVGSLGLFRCGRGKGTAQVACASLAAGGRQEQVGEESVLI